MSSKEVKLRHARRLAAVAFLPKVVSDVLTSSEEDAAYHYDAAERARRACGAQVMEGAGTWGNAVKKRTREKKNGCVRVLRCLSLSLVLFLLLLFERHEREYGALQRKSGGARDWWPA